MAPAGGGAVGASGSAEAVRWGAGAGFGFACASDFGDAGAGFELGAGSEVGRTCVLATDPERTSKLAPMETRKIVLICDGLP